MPYLIDPAKPVAKNVRRLARRELDRAIAAADDPAALGVEASIHEIRKRCKKVRALLRLARPGLGREFARANRQVRDAARELGPLRDATAMLGTFDALVAATHGDRLPGDALGQVRARLARDAMEVSAIDADATLAQVGAGLQVVRDGVRRWSPDDDVAVLLEGLAENHARGRQAFRRARRRTDDATLHEWRKRAKYERHHVRLLRPLAPSALRPQGRWLDRLSDGLGDDHDLAVLRTALSGSPDRAGAEAVALIDAVRADLQDRCLRVGARIYAEPPGALTRRIDGYWAAWHALGRERPVGSIADLASEPADRPPHAELVGGLTA